MIARLVKEACSPSSRFDWGGRRGRQVGAAAWPASGKDQKKAPASATVPARAGEEVEFRGSSAQDAVAPWRPVRGRSKQGRAGLGPREQRNAPGPWWVGTGQITGRNDP